MKFRVEITCLFGSQQQNDVINLIASIDTFYRPSFVKQVKRRRSANLNSTDHFERLSVTSFK